MVKLAVKERFLPHAAIATAVIAMATATNIDDIDFLLINRLNGYHYHKVNNLLAKNQIFNDLKILLSRGMNHQFFSL